MKKLSIICVYLLLYVSAIAQQQVFRLNELEYFENGGVNVMAFQDIYPEGHQGGVAIIMHGMRIATNGDLRLDETPGQWQPIPKQKKRMVDQKGHSITAHLTYPDSAINRKGFNPIFYPDLYFNYTVRTRAEGESIKTLSADIARQGAETPFGVPYRPHIWGAGWDIQSFGVRQYFLHRAFPDIFPADYIFNALNFILGVHPGSNTSSFASGVGARSTTVAYGVNRADWSYIPGGVSSGTALIHPDFPELLDWPYLWQQQEYVMGGGATNFMFLVLAADQLLDN